MKRTCIVTITGLCAMLLAWTSHAQDKSPQQNQPLQEVQVDSSREKLLNLDFPGGTAADYVVAVRKAAADANIVVMADLSSIAVPAIQLKSVDVRSALDVMNSIPQNQPGRHGEVRVGADMPGRNRPGGSDERPVYTISAQIVTVASGERDSTVMDISDLIEGQTKPADVLTAIETALEMLKGDYQPAQVRFHEATGLLIARGHPEQIGAVQRVVQQLHAKMDRIRSRAREANAERVDAQNAAEMVKQLDQVRHQMEDLARQSAEWKTKSDVLQSELERARNELQVRDRSIQQLQQQLTALSMERDQKKP